MTNRRAWSTTTAITGLPIAGVLLFVFDVTVPWVFIFLGLWLMAGASLRILVEYFRVKRTVEEAAETTDPPESTEH